jgi:hypothetical protein
MSGTTDIFPPMQTVSPQSPQPPQRPFMSRGVVAGLALVALAFAIVAGALAYRLQSGKGSSDLNAAQTTTSPTVGSGGHTLTVVGEWSAYVSYWPTCPVSSVALTIMDGSNIIGTAHQFVVEDKGINQSRRVCRYTADVHVPDANAYSMSMTLDYGGKSSPVNGDYTKADLEQLSWYVKLTPP